MYLKKTLKNPPLEPGFGWSFSIPILLHIIYSILNTSVKVSGSACPYLPGKKSLKNVLIPHLVGGIWFCYTSFIFTLPKN